MLRLFTFFSVFAVLVFSANQVTAQLNYSTNFDVANANPGEGQWDNNGWNGDASNTCSGALSMSDNCFGTSTSQIIELENSSSLGTSLGGDLTLEFDYKILDWNTTNATADADFKEMKVFSSSDGSSWSLQQTYSSHTPSTSCATKSLTFSHPAGNTFIKIEIEHDGGDFDVYIDDLSVVETTCADPAANYSVIKDCGNAQYTIDVQVTSLGDASGVDITDGTTTFETNVGTGTYSIGPFAAGVATTVQVNGTSYGGCDITSSALNELCNCATPPTAAVSSGNLDCGGSTYDIEVTIDSDGSGDVNKSDIRIDGAIVQTDATTGNLYTFSVAVGPHTVTIDAEGTGFVTCNSTDYNETMSCDNDECAEAFEVVVDGGVTTSLNTNTYSDSGNDLSCDGGTSDEDAYYSFVAPASGWVLIHVEHSGLSGSFTNEVEGAIYESCADAASNTEVICFNSGNDLTTPQQVTGLTAGQTYLLEIENYRDDWSGTYEVEIIDLAPELEAGVQSCDDMNNYSQNLADTDCNTCGSSDPDWMTTADKDKVWMYTATSTGTVDIEVVNTGFTDDHGFLFTTDINDVTCGIASACNDAGSNATLTATGVAVTSGVTYYLIVTVDGFGSNPDGNACVTVSPVCGSTGVSSVPTVDCNGGTYTGSVNFSALSGATTYNLEDDNGTTYSGISTATNYDFVFADLAVHSITLKGYDGSSNLICEDSYTVSSGCNGSDSWSATAPLLTTGNCYPGDLSTATVDGPTNFGINGSSGGVTGFSTNSLRSCGGGFDNATDWKDVWYRVDLPDGTDEMTLSVNGLDGGEYVSYVLNTGNPGASNGNNQASTATANEVNMFFSNTVTSHTIDGLADESTSDLYIRILTADPDNACGSITTPDFEICVSYDQPNDEDGNAIEIDGASSTGNLCEANAEVESTETGDACGESGEDEDLWYKISAGAGEPNALGKISVTFVNATDAVVITEHSGTSSNTYEECVTLTSTGAGSTVSYTFADDIPAGSSNYYRVRPAAGNGVCNFSIAGERVAENDECSYFNNVLPGYDLDNGSFSMDFNFASESGKDGISGKDLWYTVDHNSNQSITIATTSQTPDWDGTASIYLYEYPSFLSLDCDNLVTYCSQTGLDDGDLESGVTFNLGTGDYLFRIVETAVDPGGDQLDVTITGTTSATTILSNSDCANALDISSGSQIGNFTEAQLACPASIISCGATNYSFFASDPFYGAALWYKFTMPGASCGGGAPTASTEIRSIEISVSGLATGSGAGTKNAYIELYSDCNTLMECGGSINNSSNVTFEGLTPGDTYYLRLINNTLVSTSTSNFTVDAIIPGEPAPCNDYVSDAHELTVTDDLDVASLPIYSGDGATVSELKDDVWFKFTAPAANGDVYPVGTANLSFVTVFTETISGDGYEIELWDLASGTDGATDERTAIDPQDRTVSSFANDFEFIQFGHLVPGEEYWIQVKFALPAKSGLTEKAGSNERFKLAVLNPGESNSTLCSSGTAVKPSKINGCEGDCHVTYKFEVRTSGTYQVEATGDGVDVAINMFQADTEVGGEQEEGYAYDYDHPCQIDRHTVGSASSTSIPSNTHGCPIGNTGERNTYNLVGSSSTNRIYYFIEVVDQSNGGSKHGCGGPELCELRVFKVGSSTDLYNDDCKFSWDPLPVEMISFTGQHLAGDNILNWSTASEINNSHFELEVSKDGHSFEVVGRVEGNGNSSSTDHYNFKHEGISDEILYYRLIQFDFDGGRNISDVVVVKADLQNQVVIYPNPIQPNTGITITSGNQIKEYEIIDAQGRIVRSESINASRQFDVSTEGLSKGIYYFVVKTELGSQLEKLVIR